MPCTDFSILIFRLKQLTEGMMPHPARTNIIAANIEVGFSERQNPVIIDPAGKYIFELINGRKFNCFDYFLMPDGVVLTMKFNTEKDYFFILEGIQDRIIDLYATYDAKALRGSCGSMETVDDQQTTKVSDASEPCAAMLSDSVKKPIRLIRPIIPPILPVKPEHKSTMLSRALPQHGIFEYTAELKADRWLDSACGRSKTIFVSLDCQKDIITAAVKQGFIKTKDS